MRWSPGRIAALVIVGAVLVVGLMSVGAVVEFLDAGHVMVVQFPNGKLNCITEPGPAMQWFGSVTKYPKRDQFWFSSQGDQGTKKDDSIATTFNDGGRAKISGGMAWEMPKDCLNIIALHIRYRSPEAIEHQLIRTVVEKVVNFTGPLMSSTESFAARKNDLLFYIEDQIVGGVYKTESQQVRMKDTMTGVERTVTQVNLVRGAKGYERQDHSPISEFGIRTFNLAINNIVYDQVVADQIKQQQGAFAQVATAIAQAKEAEQRAITAEKNGQADAAKAKWMQEVIKAKEVTEAQMRKEVATLDAMAAAETKRKLILEGEGEAAKRQLIMVADGALEKKLATYLETQRVWAGAFKEFKGQLVPTVQTGATAGGSNAALDFMNLMSIKAARELAVDLQAQTGKK